MSPSEADTAFNLGGCCGRPEALLSLDRTAALALPPDAVSAMQIAAIQTRFAALRNLVTPLENLAVENGVDEVSDFNDAAKLLFKHSIYKSYPASLIEKNRFDRLTDWLGRLTTVDLSRVDTSGVVSIDGWIDALLRDAGVRIVHSTGTSGKLSFLPVGPEDLAIQARAATIGMQAVGAPVPCGLNGVPMIVVGHRTMFNGYGAKMEALLATLYGGDERMLIVMNPGRLSADVLSLAGRLAVAENRGALGRSLLSPAIAQSLDSIREGVRDAPTRRREFFDRVFARLRGKRVALSGNWAMLHELMSVGRERGVGDGVFAQDSLVQCAGGTKGQVFPEGFREEIRRFLGVPRINEGYGMSEIPSLLGMCEEGFYHAPPWLVPFVLDVATGDPSPRVGTHTGRFGVIDVTLTERWGGVLSGDEVTMSFGRCACGRLGAHLADTVRRLSEREGGDDKITCAGAPAAHDNALAFLAELED